MAIGAINLGNSFTNSSGSTVLGGVASGLDTQSLLTAAVAGQNAQITSLNDQITVNNNQVSSLSTLNQLLAKLQTDTTALSSPQSPDSSSNVFASRTSTVTSNTTQAASSFLTTSVTTAASPATYTISNISQTATATIQESNAFNIANVNTSVVAATATAGMFTAGTFTINGQSITLTAGETLSQVSAAFNAANAANPSSGISANAEETSPGVYKLILTGVSTGAANGFNLNATQTNTIAIASANTATTGQITADTYSINGVNVTINSGDSLNQIAADFNNAGAGVTATVQQVASGEYTIVFTGSTDDLANNASSFDLATSSNVTSGADALSNVLFTTDQQAQDAQFELNGVAIDRPNNTISDLVTGVTFNLLQNTNTQPGASFTVTVTPDTNAIATAIGNFADDYNNFLAFYAQQTQVDTTTGAVAATAYLHSDTMLQSIYNQLTSYAASVVGGISSSSATLPDIGLQFGNVAATSTTPEVVNTLSVDSTALASAITSNLSGIEGLFGYNATTSNSSLGVYSGPSNLSLTNISVSAVTGNTPPYTATYTDSSGTQQTVTLTATSIGSGEFSLSAPSTSGLAGLVLIYTGSGNDPSMTISATNGIAYQMNLLLKSATTANTGSIAVDQAALATKSQTTQSQINTINTQITNTQNTLLTKFSALESAISAANSSLDYLNAQQAAQSAAAG